MLAWEMKLEPDEENVWSSSAIASTWPAAKKITYGQGS